MTRVSGDWLADPGTTRVMKMLAGAGHQAWFVGGCVRDALIGRPISDIDIATDAEPEAVLSLARGEGLHAIPTGIEHGTVTIVSGRAFEVTTFRRDVETDGRRAVVAFAQEVDEDAHRRDLTINALYADANGAVRDPVGGVEDLRARRIRFIGKADERIREDYLRILRYFRFYAWYGRSDSGPDDEALSAITANSAGLETVSKERIGAEVLKLLAAPDPAPSLAVMAATGILAAVLPGSDATNVAPLVHLEGDEPANPIRRLAAICAHSPVAELRLSRADAKSWKLVAGAARAGLAAHELGYRLGGDLGADAALVKAALQNRELDARELPSVVAGSKASFPIAAADLAPLSGKALGEKLKFLEQRWIDSRFSLTKEELLA